MSDKNLIGPRVRQLRVAKGFSQEVFAAKCNLKGWDISRGTLSKIEARLRRVNDAEVFVLATTLRCSILDLYKGTKLKEAVAFARNGVK